MLHSLLFFNRNLETASIIIYAPFFNFVQAPGGGYMQAAGLPDKPATALPR
jgi:hypothetical protein